MTYRYLFSEVATDKRFVVRARDAEAAIRWVENNLSGEFDCLAQYADKEIPGEPLATWEPGEP